MPLPVFEVHHEPQRTPGAAAGLVAPGADDQLQLEAEVGGIEGFMEMPRLPGGVRVHGSHISTMEGFSRQSWSNNPFYGWLSQQDAAPEERKPASEVGERLLSANFGRVQKPLPQVAADPRGQADAGFVTLTASRQLPVKSQLEPRPSDEVSTVALSEMSARERLLEVDGGTSFPDLLSRSRAFPSSLPPGASADLAQSYEGSRRHGAASAGRGAAPSSAQRRRKGACF